MTTDSRGILHNEKHECQSFDDDKTLSSRVGNLRLRHESGHPTTGADACSSAAIGELEQSARPFYPAERFSVLDCRPTL